jgi:hypothetical protein
MDFAPTLSLHSLQSRNFTRRESTKISALYRAIVSLRLLPPLLSAYAILPPARSGAGVVAAQPSSGSTLVVITPYGMLLLSFEDELDATSAELVMSFTKGFTEGPPDMDNPISADQAHADRINELEDQEKLLYALREIAETSEDAESVRVAFIALSTTTVGSTYIRENPIKL